MDENKIIIIIIIIIIIMLTPPQQLFFKTSSPALESTPSTGGTFLGVKRLGERS
jgi:hypothetical protein